MLVFLPGLAIACGGRPAADVKGFRAATGRAIRVVRGEAPERARQLERLLTNAEVATAAEAATPWWQGSVGRTEAAWERVLRAAAAASRETRLVRASLVQRADGLLRHARDEVARARAEFRETGMSRREAAAMERAVNRLTTAEHLLRQGSSRAAAVELEAARADALIVHSCWVSVHARFSDPALRRQWQQWASEAIAESRQSGEPVIVIDKLSRQVHLYKAGRLTASFHADLGANGLRRKEHSGDRATPEGRYRVTARKERPSTRYHKALLINYPNDEDRMRFALGKRRGTIPSRVGIGNLIEIHGEGGEGRDWTDGCVALSNPEMDRVYALARVGTPVTIVGTYAR